MASSVATSSSLLQAGKIAHFQLSFRGQIQRLEVATSSSIAELQGRVAELTHVDATHQKLLGSGPVRSILGKAKDNEEKTLEEVGLFAEQSKPIKIMVVGPTSDEVDAVEKGDKEAEKRNRPRQYHPSMLKGAKPRSTAGSASVSSNPFHSLKVHPLSQPSSKEYEQVLSRLRKLSTDPAVVHVCRLHGFQVGELTELLPHEHPNLLGLNENMGQRISVRVRTDTYAGLIHYKDTRTVLLHELAHNKINDHPPEFKILNSELNAQVEAFERQVRQGTHHLSDMDVYVPVEKESGRNSEQETAHVLGGTSIPVEGGEDDVQSRRRQVLMATMKRLEKTEAEIEKGCGSTA